MVLEAAMLASNWPRLTAVGSSVTIIQSVSQLMSLEVLMPRMKRSGFSATKVFKS